MMNAIKNPCIFQDTGTNKSCYHSASHMPRGIRLFGFAPVKKHRFKSLGDVTVAPVAPT